MLDITKTLVFLDTESTGILKNDKNEVISNGEMIQLGYRKVENGTKKDANIYIDTDAKIEIWAMATHNIYPEMLKEKSGWKKIEDIELERTIFTDNILVAHNAAFDIEVLKRSGIECSELIIDTLKVAKTMLSEWVFNEIEGQDPEYVNLQYLRYYFKHYEILDKNGNPEITTAHDAFGDVVVLEKIFESMYQIIEKKLGITGDDIIDLMLKITQKEYTLLTTMTFGKYRGKTFEEVATIDRRYLDWIIDADFPDDVKYTCSVWLGEREDEKFFQ